MFKKQISEHKFRRVWESVPKDDISYKYMTTFGIYQICVEKGNMRYIQHWRPDTGERVYFSTKLQ